MVAAMVYCLRRDIYWCCLIMREFPLIDLTGFDPAASASVAFSGKAYISGQPFTGLNSDTSKPYVKCTLNGGGGGLPSAEESAGPMPSSFGPSEEWYEKAEISGSIHIPNW